MKTFLHLALAAWLALLAGAPASAQDKELGQYLKERLAERRNKAAAKPDGEIEKIHHGGHHFSSIRHGGLKREYRVYVPTNYRPDRPVPLVVALHGGGGNMDFQADDERYGLISKAESAGFIVLFPNGYSRRASGKLATWNAGRCCGAARDENIDDLGFLRSLVSKLSRQLNIDASRVYATGMSNGAMMAYRLACEASDMFAAIATVAGTDNTVKCSPARPVSVFHIHANDDTHVLFGGGAGPDAREKTSFTSVPDTMNKWAGLNQCPAKPQRVINKPGAYCDLYAPCNGGSQVKLCVTESGGHSWPGAEKTRGGPASQALSATDMLWEFFQAASD